MKTTFLKICGVVLLITLIVVGCHKDELPPFQAKGKIIAVTAMCYGEIVLIEVENPTGIGVAGTFAPIGYPINTNSYQNAIGVPYFSKIGIPTSVPQTVGTSLYFEYRELTDEEWGKSNLFSTYPPIVCLAIYLGPDCKKYIITKILDYKEPQIQ